MQGIKLQRGDLEPKICQEIWKIPCFLSRLARQKLPANLCKAFTQAINSALVTQVRQGNNI